MAAFLKSGPQGGFGREEVSEGRVDVGSVENFVAHG
jgi:hypothetical protein